MHKTDRPEAASELIAPPAAVTERPAESVSKFEEFIAGTAELTVSTDIKQFGYDLFAQPVAFAPSTDVPVGPEYVIGPGDEIRIAIWGKIEGAWDVIVDRDGRISLPKVGVIGVTGLTFSELRDLLQREFSRYYTGFQMNVSMGRLRTIRVYMVGNAVSPGAYTVSSLSTLVNAFIQAGGPSKTGTMRDIQVKRNGETIVHFDMYDFLLKGDKTGDIRLMPEDVIFIPPVGPLSGIAGNVKNPAIYELKGETRLLDLIGMSGGLTSVAFRGRVQVERITDYQFRTIFEGDLMDLEKKQEKNFVLQDGDLVKVFSIFDSRNTVNLIGAVANPGEFGIMPGVTTVRDVISLAGGLLYYASKEAELTRVTVSPTGPITQQSVLDVFKAMEGDPKHNIPFERNDYLMVRTVPDWKLYRTVSILGEVKYPGKYTIKQGERLASLLERAGGYTDDAYLRGAIFTRKSVMDIQQKALNEMIIRLERELISGGAAEAATAVSAEALKAATVELEQKRKFIESLKELKALGRISIYLDDVRLLKNSDYNIELEEGDSLFIPIQSSVINVTGSVMSPGSFVYTETLDYERYIAMAGGYSNYADEKNIYVLKVDGTARRLSNGFMKWNSSKSRWEASSPGDEIKAIEPGDTVVVPEKLERIAWMREIKDITQILYQIATAAGVLIVAF
ncbi:MAG: SLBB domain-containing protein [Nitrospiraceae bacterium]|nr:MAG: SLBB domain-containing protein [Nitrospiraceae bacterium]